MSTPAEKAFECVNEGVWISVLLSEVSVVEWFPGETNSRSYARFFLKNNDREFMIYKENAWAFHSAWQAFNAR